MDEKKTNEEVKQEKTTPTEEAGDKPKTNTLIDDQNLASKRMEDATKSLRKENDRMEHNYSMMKIGGQSEAGGDSKPQLTDEEKATQDKIKAYGQATGSDWAKDEEDGS